MLENTADTGEVGTSTERTCKEHQNLTTAPQNVHMRMTRAGTSPGDGVLTETPEMRGRAAQEESKHSKEQSDSQDLPSRVQAQQDTHNSGRAAWSQLGQTGTWAWMCYHGVKDGEPWLPLGSPLCTPRALCCMQHHPLGCPQVPTAHRLSSTPGHLGLLCTGSAG